MQDAAAADLQLQPGMLTSKGLPSKCPQASHDARAARAMLFVLFVEQNRRFTRSKRSQGGSDKLCPRHGTPGTARAAPFASRAVRRALLTPQVNPGSPYRCG